MKDIKLKPPMEKPKTRDRSASLPRDVSAQMRRYYLEQRERKAPQEEESSTTYATNRVEDAAQDGVYTSATTTKRAAQYAGKKLKERAQRVKTTAPETDMPTDPPAGDAPATGNPPVAGQPRQGRADSTPAGKPSQSASASSARHADIPSAPTPQERGRTAFREQRVQEITAKRQHIGMADSASHEEYRLYNGGQRHSAPRSSGEPPQAAGKQAANRSAKNAQSRQKAARAQTAAAKQRTVLKSKQMAKKLSPTQQAAKRAKQKAQKEAQRQMIRQTAQAAKAAAKAATKAAVALGKAIAAAVKALASAIAAGGWVAVVVIVVIVLFVGIVAAVASSPFGIFFSDEDTAANTVPVSQVAAEQNAAFAAQIDAIMQNNPHDSMTLTGTMADWAEVLAVFAVKTTGSEDGTAMDVVTIDAARVGIIQTIFNEMNSLSYTTDSIEHPDSNPSDAIDDSWTEKVLKITITAKTAADMAAAYGFTATQLEMLDAMLEQRAMLNGLVGSLAVTNATAAEVLRALPAGLPEERKSVIQTAMQLVGKVGYFWGGKSHADGWDSRWGKPTKVWAEGSATTGTIRAFGLDCSGYVDWVFHNAHDYVIGHGGGAASQHTYCEDIAWAQAQIGDLAFYPDDEHIGIVCGFDENGEVLIVHCASGYNNVVITGKEGFTSVARPDFYAEVVLNDAA